MFGRRTNSHIPCLPSMLENRRQDGAAAARLKTEKRRYVADNINSGRRELPALHIGDAVRMQPLDNQSSLWKPATVTKPLRRRTYEVTTEGGRKYTRNRLHLRLRKDRDTPRNPSLRLPFLPSYSSLGQSGKAPECEHPRIQHNPSEEGNPKTPCQADVYWCPSLLPLDLGGKAACQYQPSTTQSSYDLDD